MDESPGRGISLSCNPGFVWHAKIAYFPGIWIEVFDYYVHREAGMFLNLFSVFPLDNAYGDKIKTSSLFRYLASAPLFPLALLPGASLEWKNVSDSTARVRIRDNNLCTEANVHFDGYGRIKNIEACHRIHSETHRPVPGYFKNTFSDYTDVQGFKIPRKISSEQVLHGRGIYLYRVSHYQYRIRNFGEDIPERTLMVAASRIPIPYRIIALMQERNRLFAYPLEQIASDIWSSRFRCTSCGACCTRAINNHIFLLDHDVTEIKKIDPDAYEPAPGPEFCDQNGMLYVSGYALRMKEDTHGSCWFLEDGKCPDL